MSKTDSRRPAGSGTAEPSPPHHGAPHSERSSVEHRLTGIAVGSGIAIGPAYLFEDHTPDLPPRMVAEDETAGEIARLDDAVSRSRRQLGKLRAQLTVLPD
jgi:hypothetical protein